MKTREPIRLGTPARSRRKPRLRLVSAEGPSAPMRATLMPLGPGSSDVVLQVLTLAEWDATPPSELPDVARYLPGVGVLVARLPVSRLEADDIRDQMAQAKEDHKAMRDAGIL